MEVVRDNSPSDYPSFGSPYEDLNQQQNQHKYREGVYSITLYYVSTILGRYFK